MRYLIIVLLVISLTSFAYADEIDKLYETYGKLMVQLEILNNQINRVKSQIVVILNKPLEKVVE